MTREVRSEVNHVGAGYYGAPAPSHVTRCVNSNNPFGHSDSCPCKTDPESWVPVRGYEGAYEVSSHGRVRSLDRIVENNGGKASIKGMPLKANPDVVGYPSVALWRDGKSKTVRVHRLVASAFVAGEHDDLEVCHGDGDRTNNHFENLRWDTRAANMQDMLEHGRNAFANRTECPKGHPYDDQNTIVTAGRRACRACRNALRRRRRAETSEARARRDARDQAIESMRSGGATDMEIAEAVGFTAAGVRAALARINRARVPDIPVGEPDYPVSPHERWWK